MEVEPVAEVPVVALPAVLAVLAVVEVPVEPVVRHSVQHSCKIELELLHPSLECTCGQLLFLDCNPRTSSLGQLGCFCRLLFHFQEEYTWLAIA